MAAYFIIRDIVHRFVLVPLERRYKLLRLAFPGDGPPSKETFSSSICFRRRAKTPFPDDGGEDFLRFWSR
jgi:hypothetical protein